MSFDWPRSTPDPAKTVELAPGYRWRATRFPLDVLVSFLEDDSRHEGQCINVSESGLLARFDLPPQLWTEGKIELETGGQCLSIHARVARLEANDVGFAFCIKSANDVASIEILIGAVTGRLKVETSAEIGDL